MKQIETTYLSDLQRRTDMSVNERKHHENHIDRQLIEKEKAQRDFEIKLSELRERFENEKRQIGTMETKFSKTRINFSNLSLQNKKIKKILIGNYKKKVN